MVGVRLAGTLGPPNQLCETLGASRAHASRALRRSPSNSRQHFAAQGWQDAGRSSTRPSCMRLASRSSGLARAMQDQELLRCNCLCAMLQRVSPGPTVYFLGARGGAAEAGTTICEPTSRRWGFGKPGLKARSSCQRCPSPRRAAANFQSESPGRTVTSMSFPGMSLEDGGATGAGGGTGSARTSGGAGKTGGRSKGDRLTNGRNGATTRGAGGTTVGGATVTGGSKGWAGGLGEASTGASAKGR